MVHDTHPNRSDLQYLVDTDWAIEYMHGREPVTSRLVELFPYGLATSIVAVAELYEGEVNSTIPEREARMLQGFLADMAIIPLDEAICRIFARERSRLRASGNLIGDLDILIGATALCHGLTVLTNNRRHFERLQGLSIISA